MFAEIDVAVQGVDFAMAGFAGGGDAVKGVGAHFGTDEDVVGAGEAEEVTGFAYGEFFVAPTEDVAEVFFEEGAAESVAVKIHGAEGTGGTTAEIFPTAALEDAVEGLAVAEVVTVFLMFGEGALGPSFGASHGFYIIFISVGEAGELIKGHVDIGTDLTLDAHGFFGADEIGLAIKGVGEIYATFGDVGETFFMGGVCDGAFAFHGDDFAETGAEGHDLEATGIGEGGAMPAVPGGKATGGGDFGGFTAEVITVTEHGLGVE